MDRIIAWLPPVSQQKHVSQSVCLSHGDFDSRFAQAGQAEKHLGRTFVPALCLGRIIAA
jgi:hypothetical protein